MRAGDQEIIGEKKFNTDNKIKDNRDLNVNVYPIKDIMKLDILQTTKKSKPVYNYNALATNIIMNYTIFKAGDDYQKLLNKVFKEDAKVKNSVFFSKTIRTRFFDQKKGEYGRYSFYADRYDYLRIAKTMMEDWHNDTCAGKYLKTIYENRVKKKDNVKHATDVGLYTKSYGGQIHFDLFGIKKERKILGLSGFAGQNILIDLDLSLIHI